MLRTIITAAALATASFAFAPASHAEGLGADDFGAGATQPEAYRGNGYATSYDPDTAVAPNIPAQPEAYRGYDYVPSYGYGYSYARPSYSYGYTRPAYGYGYTRPSYGYARPSYGYGYGRGGGYRRR